MEAAQQKQFKFTDEIREKVLKFGECYFGALRPEEKGSYPEFLSALNKEHPEINLKSHVTFFKYFPGLIEKWKRDFGKTFRSKALTKQFKQEAGETFIEVLSSLESAEFRSIGYDDLFQLADERNPDLHLLKDHKPKTLKNNFHLDKLKKAASERRAPEAREQATCAETAAGDVGDTRDARLDAGPAPASRPGNEEPCVASEPGAAGAARGEATAERLRARKRHVDPIAFNAEEDHCSLSNATAAVGGLCDGADVDGSEGAFEEARDAATICEGPAAVAGEPATVEAAEKATASRESYGAEGRGGNMNGSASGTAVAAASLASDPGTAEDILREAIIELQGHDSHPRAEDAARGGAAVGRPLDAGDGFALPGGQDKRREGGCNSVAGLCDGADGDGSDGAHMAVCSVAGRSSEGPAATAHGAPAGISYGSRSWYESSWSPPPVDNTVDKGLYLFPHESGPDTFLKHDDLIYAAGSGERNCSKGPLPIAAFAGVTRYIIPRVNNFRIQ